MSRLPTTVGPIPPRPSTWRIVAAAVAVLCANRRFDARCGTEEVAAFLGLSAPGALRALCVAETHGAVLYRDGAWGPA